MKTTKDFIYTYPVVTGKISFFFFLFFFVFLYNNNNVKKRDWQRQGNSYDVKLHV